MRSHLNLRFLDTIYTTLAQYTIADLPHTFDLWVSVERYTYYKSLHHQLWWTGRPLKQKRNDILQIESMTSMSMQNSPIGLIPTQTQRIGYDTDYPRNLVFFYTQHIAQKTLQ